MSKILKYALITVAVIFTVGFGLVIASVSMGANIGDINKNNNNNNGGNGQVQNSASSVQSSNNSDSHAQSYQADKANNIHSISIDIGAAEVNVVYGDEFKVETSKNNMVRQWVENGEWKIETLDFKSGIFSGMDANDRRIAITIPTDFTFRDIEIDAKAAQVNFDNARATKIDVEVAAGAVYMTGVQCDLLDINVEAGDAEITGDVNKRVEADCSVGNITLELVNKGEFGYSIESNPIGEITIDSNSYSAGARGQGSGIFYDLECDMGAITITHK